MGFLSDLWNKGKKFIREKAGDIFGKNKGKIHALIDKGASYLPKQFNFVADHIKNQINEKNFNGILDHADNYITKHITRISGKTPNDANQAYSDRLAGNDIVLDARPPKYLTQGEQPVADTVERMQE